MARVAQVTKESQEFLGSWEKLDQWELAETGVHKENPDDQVTMACQDHRGHQVHPV